MKVVADNLARIALEKKFLIDELELTGYFNFYSHDLDELRSMCNALIDGKRTGGRLKSLIIDNPVSLSENTLGFKDCLTLETVSLTLYENNMAVVPNMTDYLYKQRQTGSSWYAKTRFLKYDI